jgi:hypothetical protein
MNLGRCKGWCSKETIWYRLQPSASCCQWKLVWCMGIREARVGKACLPEGACNLGRTDSLYTFRRSTSIWRYSAIYQYMPWVRYRFSVLSHKKLCSVLVTSICILVHYYFLSLNSIHLKYNWHMIVLSYLQVHQLIGWVLLLQSSNRARIWSDWNVCWWDIFWVWWHICWSCWCCTILFIY